MRHHSVRQRLTGALQERLVVLHLHRDDLDVAAQIASDVPDTDDVDVPTHTVGAQADVLRCGEASELLPQESLNQWIEFAFTHPSPPPRTVLRGAARNLASQHAYIV